MSIVSPTPGCSYKPVQVLVLLDWLLAALELVSFFRVALSLVLNWSPHRSGTRSEFLWRRVCGATWLGPMPCGTTSWRHKLGATNSRACPGLGFSRGFMLSFLSSDHRATPTSDRHCSPPSHCSNEQCACHQACGCWHALLITHSLAAVAFHLLVLLTPQQPSRRHGVNAYETPPPIFGDWPMT